MRPALRVFMVVAALVLVAVVLTSRTLRFAPAAEPPGAPATDTTLAASSALPPILAAQPSSGTVPRGAGENVVPAVYRQVSP